MTVQDEAAGRTAPQHPPQETIAEMRRRFPDLDVVFIESGGDNLAATFSPELADLTIYVIDFAGGGKIPRKGGPGITRSDLVMEADTRRMRGDRPFVFTDLLRRKGLGDIVRFIEKSGALQSSVPA